MREILEERARERARLIERARTYVERLERRLTVVAAVVAGSVARGDFNVWSDIDLVVVAEDLPLRAPERGMVLADAEASGVQAVGFTTAEFERAHARGNPLVVEALERGVVLVGEDFFATLRAT